jgi:F-type H+-transporting ATPase subunit gamma
MPGGQERILKRRIKTVQATKKITRAMELIAASRIARAQERVRQAVPYSEQITEVVKDLAAAAGGEVRSPLLESRPDVRREAFLVLVADRGLCGGYNSSVLRAAEGEVKRVALEGREHGLVTVGRKAETYFRFRGYPTDASFSGFSERPTYADAKAIATTVMGMYERGEIDRLEIIYTRFISAGVQEVLQRPLIPLDRDVVRGGDAMPAPVDGHAGPQASYEFEPSPEAILDSLLPRYVEARIYAALLNASASEQAARQRAMKAATDNAEDLIVNLSRIMNRARQDAITTEIMEIVGGAEALKSDDVVIEEHIRIELEVTTTAV